jgi:anthranilate phosphoribosyltransferase
MHAPTTTWFSATLNTLMDGRELSLEGMEEFLEAVLSGRLEDLETGTLLVALRMKGETAGELAAAAGVLRRHMVALETGRADLLDTCGTGGDGSGTFNVSTATALVAAGAGVPVVKHGNRAMSSSSGSADVLGELGVALVADPAFARRCLQEAGLAFCLAPHFHPAMARVGALRRRLGVRTLFNCLGPLLNPARAAYQLLGVGRGEWLDPLAGALARLGVGRALLVRGLDGLDEISLSAPTEFREVRNGTVTAGRWEARDLGLEPCSLGELRVGSVAESAAVIRAVLAGEPGPAARVVLANAAAALLVAGRADNLAQGVQRAAEAVTSGRAARVLSRLVELSREVQTQT